MISLITAGQEPNCYDKTLVSIVLTTMKPEVINYLNEKYGEKSADERNTLVDSRILETMQTYHPEIEFSSYRKSPGTDPHYLMFIIVTLNTVDAEIIIPDKEITWIDVQNRLPQNNTTISKTFPLGPVGDEEADQTEKTSDTWITDYLKRQGVELPPGVKIPQPSNQEVVKKIHTDILVKFGDGKTSFGGEGTKNIEKEIPNGMYWEDRLYRWQMTRSRK